jgi:signal transduction histidine kinase
MGFAAISLLAAAASIGWALLAQRARRAHAALNRRMLELESQLNEAEAVLAAEPRILMIWRGREGLPSIVGDMRGATQVPRAPHELLDFSLWLEPVSASTLIKAITELRHAGTAFNLGVATHEGDILEADGRTAGGLATLRLRALAGERRETTALDCALRQQAADLAAMSGLLDAAPFPVWMRGPDGLLTWVNRAYLTAVEAVAIEEAVTQQVELTGTNRPEFTTDAHGMNRARTHAVIAGAKRALDVYEATLHTGKAGFAVDVTELEEARKELSRHVRAHASTLDKITTAIAIFGPDQRLRFYNAAYAALWEIDSSWLDTHPADGEILDRLRAGRQLPEQANYRDWRAQQLGAYTTLETSETWWHLPDSRTLRVVCEQHPFGGVTYMYEDVTEQLRMESLYNELIVVQRETLDNLHEAIALFGTDGRLRLHNPVFARFWALDETFLMSKPHVDAIITRCRHLMGDETVWEEMKYAVTSFEVNRGRLSRRITRPDAMSFQFACVPLPDGNTLLTWVDVTDSARIENALRERAEALEAADRLKTNFLSTVSYELRTPLTNIIGFTEVLASGMAGDLVPRQQEYLSHVSHSSADLLSIIDAILDLTTIDAGAMELKVKPLDVATVMQDAAANMEEAIAKRDLTLSIELAENAASFMADEKRVKQVLHNLLSNAVGFSAKGGTVRMGARREGSDILLWVADTGRGIEPEFQSRAFERFQAKPAGGGHRGPGLGLAIVKSFVELHGGEVSLMSRVNKGTTVVCRFPVDGPTLPLRNRRAGDRQPAAIRQAG